MPPVVTILSPFLIAAIIIQGVHTFGAPPVGNLSWAQVYYDKVPNTHRWNLENDPVPVIYQAPMSYHVGTVNNLYADSKMKLGEVKMFSYSPSTKILGDLSVTHMGYWRRLSEEVDDGNLPKATP